MNDVSCHHWITLLFTSSNCPFNVSGYGFVDFEHAADADKASQALQTAGIQAQMAKVSKVRSLKTLLSTHWSLLKLLMEGSMGVLE